MAIDRLQEGRLCHPLMGDLLELIGMRIGGPTFHRLKADIWQGLAKGLSERRQILANHQDLGSGLQMLAGFRAQPSLPIGMAIPCHRHQALVCLLIEGSVG